MLLKSVFRTVKRSLGRYLAILSIIALGVGFFAGLRVTESAMLKTFDAYVKELKMYDLKLISTLGLSEEDVKSFGRLDGVIHAEGSISKDFIFLTDEGSDAVLHAHMLLECINLQDLVNGRLPERSNECLLDAKYANAQMIGKKIVFSGNNPSEVSEAFSYEEYTVVGLVNSPEYMNYERGTTSLAGGSVAGYVYLPRDGFSSEYFTEVFLDVETKGEAYSEEYVQSLQKVRENAEKMLEERGSLRFEEIYTAAEKEIAGKQEKFEQSKKELLKEKEQLDTAYILLQTKKAEQTDLLAEVKTELDSSGKLLAQRRKALDEAKEDPSALLDEVKEALIVAEKELIVHEQLYAEKLEMYEKTVKETEEGFFKAENDWKEQKKSLTKAIEALDEAEDKINSAKEDLLKLQSPGVYLLDRSSNIGYASFENDVAIVSGVSKVFPLFFFLVAALVCITTMTRMVGEQRTENGVLKALGYGDGAIAARYFLYAGSASVIGCVSGFLVGSRLMPMALWKVYHIMYSVERPISFVLDFKLFGGCSLLYLLCTLGTTWLVLRKDLSESTAQLMRPKAPTAGRRILPERIGFLWKRIPFLHKVTIRNIFRYKKRMVMMMIGIGGCTALLLTGFGIRDTIRPVADNQYNEITLYDALVTFLGEIGETEKNKFQRASENILSGAAFVYAESAKVYSDGNEYAVNLTIFEKAPKEFVDLHKGKEKIEFPPKNEVVVNNRFASENRISEGDTLMVRCQNGKTMNLKVSGIFDNYVYDYLYVSSESCLEQWGEMPECNTAYVKFAENRDEHAAGALLLGIDGVAAVTVSRDMRNRVSRMLESLDYIVLIVLVCAGALAFIVLYNLTNITITERIREIATLKVLGFYRNEQNSYVFRENILLTGISAFCGIPMGIALLHYVMAQIKIGSMYFGCRLNFSSYFISVLLTFIFAFAVHGALSFKLQKINMAEAMKAIE